MCILLYILLFRIKIHNYKKNMVSFNAIWNPKQRLYMVAYHENGQLRAKSFNIKRYKNRRNAYNAAYKFAHEQNHWICDENTY